MQNANEVDKQYPKQVQWIQIRAVNADINEYVEKDEKRKVWELVKENWKKSWKLCFPIIYLIIGKNLYKRLYSGLRAKDYNA